MALTSQTSRQYGSIRRYAGERSGMSRRRRRRQRQLRLLAAIVILAGGAGAFWMWLGDGEGSEYASSTDVSATPGGADQAESADTAPRSDEKLALASPLPDSTADPVIAGSNGRTPSGSEPAGSSDEASDQEQAPVITMGRSIDHPSNGDLSELLETARKQADPAPEQPKPTPAEPTYDPSGPLATTIDRAQRLADNGRPVEARTMYNRALWDARATREDRALLRRRLAELNQKLIFSPTVVENDPLVQRYTVQSGDRLSTIARDQTSVDWEFIQRINRIADPRRIRVGQTLKLVNGPFHAVIDKSDFRLDVYAGPAPQMDGSDAVAPQSPGDLPVYITSVPVGLGEYGSTPVGSWIVNDTKVENPSWKNPRTGEFFDRDDPENPVGERWIGLDGTDEQTSILTGYGIHGTVEPDSIGQERSMGCVRLNPYEVELLYELMRSGKSIVLITN